MPLPTDLPINLPARLVEALTEKGYESLTDVQSAVLAPDAVGQDLLVSAQTGSGKTVAFGLAMADQLLDDGDGLPPASAPLSLVIAPTRELALQVQRELSWLYARAGGRLATCVGGMDARTERRALERGAHIVVGTPGRLRDHIERGALDLSETRVVVLDEADEMLDFGFKEDLEFILEAAPGTQRTLLFSATVSKSIAELAATYQRDARRVSTLSKGSQHADITYLAHAVNGDQREDAVINVLRFHGAPRALVFCATREAVNRLAARLHNRGFKAVSLSGELSQADRTKALQALRDGRATVCVATDVAARGIDLPGLDLVVHAEPPRNAEGLLHRSGRTGRAGAKGVSVILVTPSRKGRVISVLKTAGVKADWINAPSAEDVRERDRERLTEHPAFSPENELEPERLAEARDLLERFGAEAVAAAFLSELETRLPAPEELSLPGPASAAGHREPRGERPARRDRSEFGEDGWFTVNLGRKHHAEPRWLVPMLCRIGQVTGADIGAIRIDETRTRFQIAAEKQAAFKAALSAPRGERDASVVVVPDGEPLPDRAPDAAPRPRPKRRDDDEKPFEPRGESEARSEKPKPRSAKHRPKGDWAPKPHAKKAKPGGPKPKLKSAGKPGSKFAGKPSGTTLKRVKRKKPKG